MFCRGRALGLLALAVASSAEAQGNLDQGKTAAQLYVSACAKIAAKRFQGEMAFRTGELSARALYVQL
jgi:hypothetical protein